MHGGRGVVGEDEGRRPAYDAVTGRRGWGREAVARLSICPGRHGGPAPGRREPTDQLGEPDRGHAGPAAGRWALSRRRLWGDAQHARSPWCPGRERLGRLRIPDGAAGEGLSHSVTATMFPLEAVQESRARSLLTLPGTGTGPPGFINGETWKAEQRTQYWGAGWADARVSGPGTQDHELRLTGTCTGP